MNQQQPKSSGAAEGLSPAVLFVSLAAMPKDSDSAVSHQRAAGQHRAIVANLRIVHEVVEMGASAMRFKNRLAFHALLNYFEDHPDVRHLIVPGIHRVSRNDKEFNTILQRFQAMSITIVTFAGDIVSGGDTHGDLTARIAQSMVAPAGQPLAQSEIRHRKALQDRQTTTGGTV